MNRVPRLFLIKRHLSSWNSMGAFNEFVSETTKVKDQALDATLDQYINFVNKSSRKIQAIEVQDGKEITVTASLNIGPLNLSTVINNKPDT